MSEQFIENEATGVYVGTLVEDMIKTVKDTGKLYCNVLVEQFFAKDSKYPLTYVPLWAMSLPLKEGDKVLVYFNQGSLMYPVLYKNEAELPKDFYTNFDVAKSVEGGNVQALKTEDTVAAETFGDGSYMIKTKNYTVFHQGNGFVLIDNKDKVYVYGSEVNVVSGGAVKVDCKQDLQLYTSASCNITATGGFTVNNHLQVTA